MNKQERTLLKIARVQIMTHEEMFNKISGEMTKANNEIADIINTYGNNMYHLGCIAGEQTAASTNKSEFAKVFSAMYLEPADSKHRQHQVTIKEFNGDVIYSGAAGDITTDILEQPYAIWTIEADFSPNSMDTAAKIITVV